MRKPTESVTRGVRASWQGGSLRRFVGALALLLMFGLSAGTASAEDYTVAVRVWPPQAGTVARAPDQATYPSGTEVTLMATANAGWTFDGWSGKGVESLSGAAPTFSVSGDVMAVARFSRTGSGSQLSLWSLGSGPSQMSDVPSPVLLDVADREYLVQDESGTVWQRSRNGTWSTIDGVGQVVDLAQGSGFELLLLADGSVLAQGSNSYGQLGDGTTSSRQVPKPVANLTNIVALSASNSHSLALGADGTVWAWGRNDSGQLGDGSHADRTMPFQVAGLPSIVAVSVGSSHSLALVADGTVWAWGSNGAGQLGDGTTVDRPIPVRATAVGTVMAVSAGTSYSAALKVDGTLWSWGNNHYRQFGIGTNDSSVTPVQANGMTGGVALAAGRDNTVVLKDDGTVWGMASTPSQLPNIDRAVSVRAGSETFAALAAKQYQITTRVEPVGSGSVTALPDETLLADGEELSLTPDPAPGYGFSAWSGFGDTPITGGTAAEDGVVSFTVREEMELTVTFVRNQFRVTARAWPPEAGSVSVSPDKELYDPGETVTLEAEAAAGWVFAGWQGVGFDTTGPSPTSITVDSDVVATACFTPTEVTPSGSLWGWGQKCFSEDHDPLQRYVYSPVLVTGMPDFIRIETGYNFSAGITVDGTLWMWGENANGQLGDGTSVSRMTPQPVAGLGKVVDVACNDSFTVALCADGTVWTWGRNSYGQLGDGTTTTRRTPGQVTGLGSVIDVACSNSHVLAVKGDGTIWSWGSNSDNRLGRSASGDEDLVPGQVNLIRDARSVSAGSTHSLALAADGTIWAWGRNSYGQLGDATTSSRLTPVKTLNLVDVVQVGCGDNFSVALTVDGKVWSWGRNNNLYLGLGGWTNYSEPIHVAPVPPAKAISVGRNHTLVLARDGTCWTWGAGSYARLGLGDESDQVLPAQIPSLADVTAISTSHYHTLVKGSLRYALDVDTSPPESGTVTVSPGLPGYEPGVSVTLDATSAEGYTFVGWAGLGAGLLPGTPTSDGSTITFDINADTHATATFHKIECVLTTRAWPPAAGTVSRLPDQASYAAGTSVTVHATPIAGWTFAGWTGLPDGSGAETEATFEITNDTVATALFRRDSASESCVWAWGYNNGGLIGDGTEIDRWSPVRVSGIPAVPIDISARGHSAALLPDGTAMAWGRNSYGSLGDGTTTSRSVPTPVVGLDDIIIMSAGWDFSHAVRADGSVWGWGNNQYGRLGLGSSVPSPIKAPVRLQGLTSTVSLGTGSNHALVARADGTVWVWGNNDRGELGDGTTTTRYTPVQNTSLSNIVIVAAGTYHSLAVDSSGHVWAWGANIGGALGDGGVSSQRVHPYQIIGFDGVVAVAAAKYYSMALRNDGTVWAWGYNNRGQLGDGTTTQRDVPTQVSGLTDVVMISASNETSMALKSDGTVWIWGRNSAGQLGIGSLSPAEATVPIMVPGLTNASLIASGGSHCMVVADIRYTVEAAAEPQRGGLVDVAPAQDHYASGATVTLQATAAEGYAFSHWTGLEGLTVSGSGATVSIGVTRDVQPVAVFERTGYRVVTRAFPAEGGTVIRSPDQALYAPGESVTIEAVASAGWAFAGWSGSGFDVASPGASMTFGVSQETLVVARFSRTGGSPNRAAWAWGNNNNGCVGDGSGLMQTSPVPVADDFAAVDVTAGQDFTVTVKADGTVWAWGYNINRYLGDGTRTARPTPVETLLLADAIAVSSGTSHTLALRGDGSVWSWGDNGYGRLGRSGDTTIPGAVDNMDEVISVSGGGSHSLVLRSDGTVYAWGYNSRGQLGDGGTTRRDAPVRVVGLPPAKAISGGGLFSMALAADGTVWTWGYNGDGALGDGTTTSSATPVQVPGLSDVVAIDAGIVSAYAVKSDGTLWAWGANDEGQLGDGTRTTRTLPVHVDTLTDIVRIEGGYKHALALDSNDTLWAWGRGSEGQLGIGNQNRQLLPVQVNGVSGVTAIAGGYNHSVVLGNQQYTLVVGLNPTNSGSATATPEKTFYAGGEAVTLQASAFTGYTFDRWTGLPVGVDDSQPTVVLAMHEDLAVTAEFVRSEYYVLAHASPSAGGTVTVTPVQASYALGESVTLEATAAAGWAFAGWDGRGLAAGAGSTVTESISSDIMVVACFTRTATMPSGSVWAWGANFGGQLGDGTFVAQSSPIQSMVQGNIARVVGARGTSAAIDESGRLWLWGDNESGRLANGGTGDNPYATQPAGLPHIVAVSGSRTHMAAVGADGSLWTWGTNDYGELGDGTTTDRYEPAQVAGFDTAVDVGAGENFTVVLCANGTVWTWGRGNDGRLGIGSTDDQPTPTQIPGLNGVRTIAVAPRHVLALLSDGSIVAWGLNYSGCLGDGSGAAYQSSPVSVLNVTNAVAIAADSAIQSQHSYSMALDGTGRIWTWGQNLGRSGTTTEPAIITDLKDTAAIATGGGHALALQDDGSVWAWGDNYSGQVGDGTTRNRSVPVQVPGLVNVRCISGGSAHSLAVAERQYALEADVSPVGAGTLTVSPEAPLYAYDSSVTLVAQPLPGFVFVHWEGVDGAPATGTPVGNGSQITVTMRRDMNVTAVFVATQYRLDVTVWPPEAAGVTRTPDQELYDPGTVVHVDVAAVAGWQWVGWSGDIAPDAGAAVDVTLSRSLKAVAYFTRSQSVASLSAWGWGSAYDGRLGDGQTSGERPAPIQAVDIRNAARIACGQLHTLCILDDGTVRAWGDGRYGTIGNGGSSDVSVPDAVLGLDEVVAVAGGSYFSMALRHDGTVWTWGRNDGGQLGLGDTDHRYAPIQVPGLRDIVDIDTEYRHSLAVQADGTVWAWGDNDYGQLGDGTTTDSSVPIRVVGLSDVMAVAAGTYHSLALKRDGTVWAWGYNGGGRLGRGNTTDSSVPVQVASLSNIRSIASGSGHSLAVTDDWAVMAWGNNNCGGLGDGSTSTRLLPVAVSGLANVVQVAGGDYYSLARKADGTVWAWGKGSSGQIGDGATADRLTPVQVSRLTGAMDISGGDAHSAAVAPTQYTVAADVTPDLSGTVAIEPDQELHEFDSTVTITATPLLGYFFVGWEGLDGLSATETGGPDGATVSFAVRRDVEAVAVFQRGAYVVATRVWPSGAGTVTRTPAKTVYTQGESVTLEASAEAGWTFTGWAGQGFDASQTDPSIAITVTGDTLAVALFERTTAGDEKRVWTCGDNDYWQVGDGTDDDRRTPFQTPAPLSPVAVSVGPRHVLAADADGHLWGWGNNGYGVLGDGTSTSRSAPTMVSDFSGVADVAAGGQHSAALMVDGSIMSWGHNNYGQLGDGLSGSYVEHDPVSVTGLPPMKGVACGYRHSVAVDVTGRVWAWGGNDYGQLGDGTTTNRTTPVLVTGLTDIVAVSACNSNSMALRADGTVWVWGYGNSGQIGNGSTDDQHAPQQVVGISNAVAIDMGNGFALAVRSGGTVWGWGWNGRGQLGDGTTTNRNTPVQAIGLTEVVCVAAGSSQSFAVKSDGTLWSCGSPYGGALGYDVTDDVTTPTQVTLLSGVTQVSSDGDMFAAIADMKYSLDLDVSPDETGTLTVEPDLPYYAVDQMVTLTATPAAGWSFSSWTGLDGLGVVGDTAPEGATATFAMTRDVSAEAVFARTHYAVRVSAFPPEGGSVSREPDKTWFSQGETVTVAATPATGWAFAGWSGFNFDTTGTDATLSFDVTGDTAVVATFVRTTPGVGRIAWSFGRNNYGQLGDGTEETRIAPTRVLNLTNVVAVGGTVSSAVALREDGTVWTWGRNNEGQLGDNTTTTRLSPVQVVGLDDVVAVSASDVHMLALTSDGSVWAWGSNGYGRLGDGSGQSSWVPVKLSLSGVVAISASYDGGMALKADGTLWAWGRNNYGQLGDGTTSTHLTPVRVSGLNGVVAVSFQGTFALALCDDGTVWAWGRNSSGQLGNGTTNTHLTPIRVVGLDSVVAIDAGASHSLAVRSDGTAWGWGAGQYDRLGNGSSSNQLLPVQVSNLTQAVGISAGNMHSLARCADGSLWAWGGNGQGQLGDGTTSNQDTPVPVSVTDVTSLSAGDVHSVVVGEAKVALTVEAVPWDGGAVSVAPQKAYYDIGEQVTLTATAAAQFVLTGWTGLESVTPIADGDSVTFNITEDMHVQAEFAQADFRVHARVWPPETGTVTVTPESAGYVAGQNVTLQAQAAPGWTFSHWAGIGFNTSAGATVTTAIAEDVLAVAYFTRNAGQPGRAVWGWGRTSALGINETSDSKLSPVRILPNASHVEAFDDVSLAIGDDGRLWGWGNNSYGQLGDATSTSRHLPVQAAGLTNVVDVAVGYRHSIGLKADGTVWTWGRGNYGLLGDGSSGTATTPRQVPALHHYIAVAAGYTHNMALKIDGTVWVWGYNGYGVLGSGAAANDEVATPIQVADIADVVAIDAGMYRSMVLRADGTVWSWGHNGGGQFGDGTNTHSSAPVQATGLTGVVRIGSGWSFGQAIKSDNTFWGWGYNYYGQLGLGSSGDQYTPQEVTALASVKRTAGGTEHALGITSDGRVWNWGRNSYGQLGDGTTSTHKLPVQVPGLTGGIDVAAGNIHSLAAADMQYVLDLSVTPESGGYVVATPEQGYYAHNQTVTLEATAVPGYTFIGWAGLDGVDVTVNGNQVTFRITRDMAVTAAFERTHYLVDVQAYPPQGGSVARSPDRHLFASGESCSLDAQASPGWSFSHWAGTGFDTSAGQATTFAVTSDVQATAFFVRSQQERPEQSVWIWGSTRLSSEIVHDSRRPTQVLNQAVDVAACWRTTIVLCEDGTAWSWGSNSMGELGIGDNTDNGRDEPVRITGLNGAVRVWSSWYHVLALMPDGTLRAWGSNSYGALGDGTTNERNAPVTVSGISGVAQASTGQYHSLAVRVDGTLWGWGWNQDGQLGFESTEDRLTPVQLSNLRNIVAAAGGGYHTLALDADGVVWAMGKNTYGALGDGTTQNRWTPQPVPGLPPIVAISAGMYHSMALDENGVVWTWGNNSYGKLGDGTTTNRSLPVAVPGLGRTVAISAGGDHSAALADDGVLWVWGRNAAGQLGDGTNADRQVPVSVTDLHDVVAVAAGGYHTVALAPRKYRLELNVEPAGAGGATAEPAKTHYSYDDAVTLTPSATPGYTFTGWTGFDTTPVTITDGVAQFQIQRDMVLTAHFERTGYLVTARAWPPEAGTVVKFPNVERHSLGDGVVLTAYANAGWVFRGWGGSGFDTSAGATATFQVAGDVLATAYFERSGPPRGESSVWDWGHNNYRQLGDDTNTDRYEPIQALNVSRAVEVACGSNFTMAIDEAGDLWLWGENRSGQMGDGATTTYRGIPARLEGLGGIVDVSGGGAHVLALKDDGTVWAWGSNTYGQLGDDTTADHATPVRVEGLDGVVAVEAGGSYSMALKANGTLWAWGRNEYGQLGDGTTTMRLTPVPVSLLQNVVGCAGGWNHALAVLGDGTVWAWGRGGYGELGDDSTPYRAEPKQVQGLGDVMAVAAGGSAGRFSMALKTDGTVWTWGYNGYGQLGNGTFNNTSTPGQIPSVANVVAIAAGDRHAMVLMADQSIKAWGDNDYGMVGDGSTTTRSSPVNVAGILATRIAMGSNHTACLSGKRYAMTADVSPELGGWADISPVKSLYALNDGVTLTATPRDGYEFRRWEGLDGLTASTDMPIVAFNVIRDVHATAVFEKTQYLITTHAWPDGGGGVTRSPSQAVYDLGDNVTLQATPASGWQFVGWDIMTPTEHVASDQATTTITVAGDTVAAARFRLDPAGVAPGTLYAWGYNNYGMIGDGSTTNRLSPVVVTGMTGAIKADGGDYFTVALKSDGTVWTWGTSGNGRLGDGSTSSRSTPGQIPGFEDVVDITCGESHALAVKADGTVWAWGYWIYGLSTTPVQMQGLTDVVAVTAGEAFSAALCVDGSVWTWGENSSGQLGDGTKEDRVTPAAVQGLPRIKAIDAGKYQMMALDEYDRLWIWGNGLLSPILEPTLTPVEISAIAASVSHSMAVDRDGNVWTWGDGRGGRLGTGDTDDVPTPAPIAVPQNVVGVAVGSSHSLALTASGDIYSWGRNYSGPLGIGNTSDRYTPTRITTLPSVHAISAGNYHSLAVVIPRYTVDAQASPPACGTVSRLPDQPNYAYGDEVTLVATPTVPGWRISHWQGLDGVPYEETVEDGVSTIRFSVTRNLNVVAVLQRDAFFVTTGAFPPTAGSVTALPATPLVPQGTEVTLTAEAAPGWAFSGWRGSGFDTQGGAVNMVTVTEDVHAVAVFTRTSDAPPWRVWSWGFNRYGQLGDGTTTQRITPGPVANLPPAVSITGGAYWSAALAEDGTVWSWGRNAYGQLGDGTTTERHLPVQVVGLSEVIAIASGRYHGLALKSDGTVWSWGRNHKGQLGDGTIIDRHAPVQVSGLTGVVALAGRYYNTLALKSDGTLWGWGNNAYGQLGDGTTTSRRTPVQAHDLGSVVAVGMGNNHAMALLADGTVRSWGYNLHGELGDGTTVTRVSPVTVVGLANVGAMAVGEQHSLFLRGDGTVWGCGYGRYGRLGDGTVTDRSTAVQTVGLSDVTSIGVGAYNSLAVKADGTVWAWGRNSYGQLGDGTTTERHTPVQTTGLTNAHAATGGSVHSLALADRQYTVSGVVNPAAAGTLTVVPQKPLYDFGDPVTVTVTPATGWQLDHWNGLPEGATQDGNSATFTVRQDVTLTAHMAREPVTLTILPSPGAILTGDPAGEYAYGTTVNLHCEAEAGYRFVKWVVNGADAGNAADLQLTMTEDKAVRAVCAFQMELTVEHGEGSGIYDEGQVVTIKATVPPKHRFTGWTGDTATVADTTAEETTITMNANYTVTATFERIIYPITVDASLSSEFVYQNLAQTTKDRHLVTLTIDVTSDENENGEFEVEVEQTGGTGDVTIRATANPLVWEIVGSRAGVGATGDVQLEIRLTGDVAGEATETAELTVRHLGDITGDGNVNLRDKLRLVKKLNGLATDVADARAFDLNGDGVTDTEDKLIINALLSGFKLP